MATDNNIKHFTALDIEKYQKGQLSPKEMHEMEKAALDDPFLADALEGFVVSGPNAAADIAELRKRLADRVEEKSKVIPLNSSRNNFRLLRAAVVIAFIAGAGLLIYQFGFNNKKEEIVQADPLKKVESSTKDNNTAPATTGVIPAEDKTKNDTKKVTVNTPASNTGNQPAPTRPGSTTIIKEDAAGEKVMTETTAITPPPAPAKTTEAPAENRNLAKEEVKPKAAGQVRQETDAEGLKDIAAKKQADETRNNRSVAANRKAEELNYRNQQTNVFRGRVTDQNNVGVPFANVTNLEDNEAGTYTDARGNFILTYPDTILTVQVRSIGFENSNVQLRNYVPNNQVTLQDDRSLSEVVISNKKPNSVARSRDATMKLEEPEPADGWDNYDSYLVNNVKLPDEYVTKQQSSGEVQVSFEVDKNGEPVNFKIEKSLCKKCDQEAIRLIKEGPKWRRKAKHGRTTVTITF
jgi:CarboxypepD_reg-like domain/Gram-negative bacterial TonB protein C-terminal